MTNKRKRIRIPKKVLKARSGKYKFSVKTHPVEGFVSVGLGAISMVTLALCCYMSWQSRGASGIGMGLAGMAAFFTAVVGMVLAVTAAKKKDVHMRFPMLGGMLNGILIILYLIIYVMGALL